jgi:hypothetical protein
MYYAVLLIDINSLKSTCYKKWSLLHIPPDPNKTSVRG